MRQTIIGGGMANAFLAAQGLNMQDSLVNRRPETAKAIMAKSGEKLILPVDAVIADKFAEDANTQVVDVAKIPAGWRMLDVGSKTVGVYQAALTEPS
ncbi:MAG: phosphoglycerate kinase [Anaerolineales bacterium]